MIGDRIDLMCYLKWNMKIYSIYLLKGDYMYEFFTDGAVSNNGKENSIGSWGFICVKNK